MDLRMVVDQRYLRRLFDYLGHTYFRPHLLDQIWQFKSSRTSFIFDVDQVLPAFAGLRVEKAQR